MKEKKPATFDFEERRKNALIKAVLFQGNTVHKVFYSAPSLDRKYRDEKITVDAMVEVLARKFILSQKFTFSSAIVYDHQSSYIYGLEGKSQKELAYYEYKEGAIMRMPADPLQRKLIKDREKLKQAVENMENDIFL